LDYQKLQLYLGIEKLLETVAFRVLGEFMGS